jgi:hypothetical protein
LIVVGCGLQAVDQSGRRQPTTINPQPTLIKYKTAMTVDRLIVVTAVLFRKK